MFGVLGVLFGVLGVLVGVLGVFFGVLGVFILWINFPKSSPFRVLCGKRYADLKKVHHRRLWRLWQLWGMRTTHTWYLSHISHLGYVEKNLSCGEISDFYTWQMWRHLKFNHICHVEIFQISPHNKCEEIWNVENSEITPHVEKFQISPQHRCYLRFMLFCRESVLSQFTRFCVEKNLSQNSICGEKMTNIRYDLTQPKLTRCIRLFVSLLVW